MCPGVKGENPRRNRHTIHPWVGGVRPTELAARRLQSIKMDQLNPSGQRWTRD